MAILLADSFDFYSTGTDMMFVGTPWTVANGNPDGTRTPYSAGQSFTASAGNFLYSVVFSNESTIYLSFNLFTLTAMVQSASNALWITLMDGANNQVSLCWALDGNFYVRAGNSGATIIGTFAHGMAPSSWCHWQCKVVIDNVNGSVELRKNNNPVNDYTLTGVNTRNGSTNAYANKFQSGCTSAWWIDDCYINSGSGAAPNTWPGQLRAVQLMPNADTAQKDLTPSAGTTAVLGYNSTASTFSASANTIYFVGGPTTGQPTFLPAIGGAYTKLTVKLNAGVTGHLTCAIYTDVSFTPTALVAQTNQVTNPGAGDNDFTFSSPPTLSDGVNYWVAIWGDVAFVLNTTGVGVLGKSQALTYTGTFPSTAGSTITTGSIQASIRATITTANYGMVNELIYSSDTDYVFGSVAGNTDIYDLQDLSIIPASIAMVVTRHVMKKSDTGARTATTRVVSGGTSADQTTVTLATTYQWQNVYFPVDPNTSVAWTYAGVNAFKIGPKIVA